MQAIRHSMRLWYIGVVMKYIKSIRREKRRFKRKHGIRVDRRPTAIQNALIKRARNKKKKGR